VQKTVRQNSALRGCAELRAMMRVSLRKGKR